MMRNIETFPSKHFGPRKSDFWPFYFFGHFPIEIPIEVENFLGRAFQSSYNENKNCFEILMTKEMALDRAPIEFQTFYFSHVWLVPPNDYIH